MMVSLCNEYYQFMLAQGVLMGSAVAFLQFPAFAIVAQFDRWHRVSHRTLTTAQRLECQFWVVDAHRRVHHPAVHDLAMFSDSAARATAKGDDIHWGSLDG
jgi:hypothetical protein